MKKKTSIKKEGKERFAQVFEAINALKEGKATLGIIVFLDIALVLFMFLFRGLLEKIAPAVNPNSLALIASVAVWYALFLLLAYYLVALLLYSIAKHFILGYTGSLFGSKNPSFERLPGFYGLNVLLAGIFVFIFAVLAYVIAAIKQPYAPYVLIILAVPYLFFLLIITSASQIFYASKGMGAIASAKKGIVYAFCSMRKYVLMLGVGVGAIILYWLLLLILGFGIKMISEANYGLYVSVYGVFKSGVEFLSIGVFYIFILFTRTGFYALIRKEE